MKMKSKAAAAEVRKATTARDSIPALMACFPKTGAKPSITAEAIAMGTPRFFEGVGFKVSSLSTYDVEHCERTDPPTFDRKLHPMYPQRRQSRKFCDQIHKVGSR
jgi:hypothetical protein